MVATAVLSTTARAKAREARKEAKKGGLGGLGRQPSLDSEIPLERVPSHLSTTSYLSMDTVRVDTFVCTLFTVCAVCLYVLYVSSYRVVALRTADELTMSLMELCL